MYQLLREECVTVDEIGIDPLLDKAYSNVIKTENFSYYRISEEEQERPDLISYRHYNFVGFWWIILAYNQIIRIEELKKGSVIKIPSLESISSLTMSSQNKNPKRKVLF